MKQECGGLPYTSLMKLGRNNIDAAEKFGFKQLILSFNAGLYLTMAKNSNKVRFAREMKDDPKKRTLQRYLKFYDDMTKYPMFVFLGGSMGKVTKESNRMNKLKEMSELPDVAEKVVGIVGELEDSFMKEIPKQIVDGFKSV